MKPVFDLLGADFGELGEARKSKPAIKIESGRRLSARKTMNYPRIKLEVAAAVGGLGAAEREQIPPAGTLPELIVGWALVKLGYMFSTQSANLGGRLRLGGGVIDYYVNFGSARVAVRVQGDYWHGLPERKQKDAVQTMRLRAQRVRVWDCFENEIYQAWDDGRILAYVDNGIKSAA